MENKGYNYIWYPLTNFVEIPSNDFKFSVAEIFSPYIELNLDAMNEVKSNLESQKNNILEVNPFIRFGEIFYELLNPDKYKFDKKLRESVFNILIHFLGELDLYLGQNKKDIIIKEMVKNIEKGAFGEKIKEDFKIFREYEKVIIADGLYCMYNYLDMLESFKKVFKYIFPDSIIYDRLTSETNIVIYLNYKNNKINQLKVNFIKEMFLPLGLEIDLFWEKHFGVIGVDITMRIGEIAIF